MQRLFSTFPNGWPGRGLLLLRICLATSLIYFAVFGLSETRSQTIALGQNLIAAIGGIFMLVGLWTPLIGSIVALDEISMALPYYSRVRGDTLIHLFLAILAVSVAMLGPGAWSIDARLFGRKRFNVDRNKGK